MESLFSLIDTVTVLLGSHVVFFLEYTVEVGEICNADTFWNLCDLHSCGQKKIGSNVESVIIDVLDTGHTHILFEETHEIVFAEIYIFCKFINSYGFFVIFADVIKDYFDISGGAVFDIGVSVFAFKKVRK